MSRLSRLDQLRQLDLINLISVFDKFYEQNVMCEERNLVIYNCHKNNFVFTMEVLMEKWLDEFLNLDLVIDRLKKRDPTFFPPENYHYNFLYYHMLCSKKDTLKETDKVGSALNYEEIEPKVLGQNATVYFQTLFSRTE